MMEDLDLPPLDLPTPTGLASRASIRKLTLLQERLLADGADCASCPLGRNGTPGRPVPTSWDSRKGPPKLALVGEAPGLQEVRKSRVFVGPSGKLLDMACRMGNVPRGEIAILNSAACGPIPSGADDIKRRALEACRPRLLTELRRLQPKTVLAIGGLALKTLAPAAPGGITALRGALLDLASDISSPNWKPHFLASLHPAFILRGGDGDGPDAPGADGSRAVDLQYYFLLYDLSKAWRLATGRARPWQDNCDLFLVHNGKLHRATTDANGKPVVGDPATPAELVEAARLVAADARRNGAFSCDVETDAKDSLDAKLTAIGFSTIEGGLSATWAAFLLVPAALDVLRDLLVDTTVDKWFWNRIYDCVVLPRHGLPVAHPIHDGLLMHHAAFPGLPHKLDAVAQQFLCVSAWKTEFRKSTRNEPELIVYNYKDAHGTILIPEPLRAVAKAHRTEQVYEADRQVVSIAQYMREFGFWIDRKEQERQSKIQHARLEYMQAELTRQFARIAPVWFDRLARNLAVGQRQRDSDAYLERVEARKTELAQRKIAQTDIPTGIKIRIERARNRKGVRVVTETYEREVYFKPKAKSDLVALFEILRIPFVSYTEKGAPVTDKKAMETAAAKHPLMRQLIHIREAQHVLATYIDGLPIKRTGRVHPDWSVIKIPGRWSAGKSQNIPKQVAGWPPLEEPDPDALPPLDFSSDVDFPAWENATSQENSCDVNSLDEPAPPPIAVNIKDCPSGWENDPAYVYCGRPGNGFSGEYGNPHPVGKFCPICRVTHNRGEAIGAFRRDAQKRFASDSTYRRFVERLRGKKGVCFCAPLPCHVGVYVELLTSTESSAIAAVPAAPPVSGDPNRAPRPGFRWKKKPGSGDWVVPIENARALITAPTIEEILEHAAIDPANYQDPRYKRILERALAGFGRKLVGADFSQLHLRIVALLGKDQFLLDAYGNNADVHSMNAAVCFPKVFPKLIADWKELAANTPYGDAKPLTLKADLSKLDKLDEATRAALLRVQRPWSKLRDLAKRLVYAWIYRGRAETAYQALVKEFPDVELAAVAEAFKLLDQRITGWVAWCARNEIHVRQNREARDPLLGRVRLFPLGNYDVTLAVNFPVIAFETVLMSRTLFRFCALTAPHLLELDKLYAIGALDPKWVDARRAEGYSDWTAPVVPIINGHDALDAECDEADAEKAMKLVLLCMDHTIEMDGAKMRFFGEGAIGRRLSET